MAGRRWPFWAFIAILVVAYFTLNLALGMGRAAPDLLTVAVLLGARRMSGAGAAGLGLGLGLMRDALSLVTFGASAVTLTLLGFLGARSRDLFVGDSLVFVGVYLLAGKWLHDAIFYGLTQAAERLEPLPALLVYAPLAGLYAAGVGLAALVLYRATAREP